MEVSCQNCSIQFNVKPSKAKTAKYCSRDCHHEAKAAKFELKFCGQCKIEFKHFLGRGASDGKFCSFNCYDAYRSGRKANNHHPCAQCGELVYRVPAHAGRYEHIFCSLKCSSQFNSGENNAAWSGGSVECVCQQCGKNVFVKKGASETKKYCSRECANKSKKGVRRSEWVSINCASCDKIFEKPILTAVSMKSKYCSRDCKDKEHAKLVSDQGNPRYIHGECLNDYSVYFARSLRRRIRERDGNRCRLCGLHEDHHGTLLHVHHINYVKRDDRIENLISLCKFCHGTMHGSLENRAKCEKRMLQVLSESRPQTSLFTM